jgi:hypothetical protein
MNYFTLQCLCFIAVYLNTLTIAYLELPSPPNHEAIYFKPLHKYTDGRAVAQAVSRWLPTAAAWVQSRVWSCGIL